MFVNDILNSTSKIKGFSLIVKTLNKTDGFWSPSRKAF